MSDEAIIVITPEILPGSGGLADYTRRVVEEWRGRFAVRLLVAQSADWPDAEPMGKNAAALLRKLPTRGGKVLLQYSAYGFDRWGYPRWLLRALTKWRQKSGGRLVLMLHETWAFWPWWNKNYPVQQLHRRDLGRLLRVADAVLTTTEKQAGQLRGLNPACEVQVLPVGANIRPEKNLAPPREPGLLVLFGRQPGRVRTLRAMEKTLHQLVSAQRITKIITAGEGTAADRIETGLLAKLKLRDGFERRGPLAHGEVSSLLLRASFGVSELDAHNVPKSSAFTIYAAHGLNIISPWSSATTEAPFCWTTHPEELSRGLPREELEARAEKLRAWQERIGSWSGIAERLAGALQINAALQV